MNPVNTFLVRAAISVMAGYFIVRIYYHSTNWLFISIAAAAILTISYLVEGLRGRWRKR